MIAWTLILTLTGYSAQSGHTMDHIDGFKTEHACLIAGTTWLQSTKNNYGNKFALCVQK